MVSRAFRFAVVLCAIATSPLLAQQTGHRTWGLMRPPLLPLTESEATQLLQDDAATSTRELTATAVY